ncbi:hypothetical protein DL95DRAFT_523974 [Leptodontidium sp. 2 PMI_412]|nr:hypothetical protein DL95DRAFT_523974 [Leptodontidium sp. 2 PMI_412]
MPVQSLDARYLDLQKLVQLLRSTFGAGQFAIDTEHGGDTVILTIPRLLTEASDTFDKLEGALLT